MPPLTPRSALDDRSPGEVAELVNRVYRSFEAEHPERRDQAIRFTLQCVVAMFAENIGLLPPQHFTNQLHLAASGGELRDFNGALFRDPVTVPITPTQLAALTEAAEADWTHVEPHIFGAVLQSIMDDDERHATGAHYTAMDDIMRVVGPTIVEPWRRRIAAATTLTELRTLREQLTHYRVLDPACGSGNFLYVAFRAIYRLETELLARMQALPSIVDDASARAAWASGIPTTNFHGIDINPVAVELARATLNIAKKLAFDERHPLASGQLALALPLPLDTLDTTIICADALFVDWPEAEAIVGNPPILGGQKIREALGADYLDKLEQLGAEYVADLSCYWFRLAQDRLAPGGRAGLVGTSGLRVGKARASSLDYVVCRGGTITNAVSTMPWAGEAALDVCVVNWTNGPAPGPHQLIVDGRAYPRASIPTHLQLHADVSGAADLQANESRSMMGVTLGKRSLTGDHTVPGFPLPSDTDYVRPLAAGTAMLTGALDRSPAYGIYITDCPSEREAAARGGRAFAYLREHITRADAKRWWEPERPRRGFIELVARLRRFIACSSPQARPIFVFLSSAFLPTNTLQVFAFEDDYSFGMLQSSMHWAWLRAIGGKVSVRPRYTTRVWRSFPWPQRPPEPTVAAVAEAARALRETRHALMTTNAWSLRALYQAADVTGLHPLEDAHARLDEAVAAAYELPSAQDPLEFLLELNLALAEAERLGHDIDGPGLPPGLEPSDPRWSSDDCIEPPALELPVRG